MEENAIEDTGTTRKKFQPVRVKDMVEYGEKAKSVEQQLSVKKKIEPMRVKDLLKSLSAVSAEAPVPSKSAERYANVPKQYTVPRQSSITPGAHGKNVRRKLYSTQNTPKELHRESRLFSTSKAQQIKTTGDVNRNQLARKSFLLPPNYIQENYVRKKLSKGTIFEARHEDASVQTNNESLADISSGKPYKPVEETISVPVNSATIPHQNAEGNCIEIISSQLTTENELNNNVERIINIRSVNTDITVPLCAADTTEKGIETESANVQSHFLRPTVIMEPRILHPLQGYSECGYAFYDQALLANQILLPIANDAETPRNAPNVPIVSSIYELASEHVIVERNKLLSIESYLKEGIVSMTQALNLVQATLCSNTLSAQVQSTVPSRPPAPIEKILEMPISDSIELREIKIEPTYGDTSPPSVLPMTFATPEVQDNNEEINEGFRNTKQMKVLQVRLENCFLKTPKKGMSKNIEGKLHELDNNAHRIENVIPTQGPSTSYEANGPETSKIEISLPQTPTRESNSTEKNFMKTPKTIDRNFLMTPCRRMDNKENLQTPMSRRKTFSGHDSQNPRRSVRIARHHLRQSLGDDSFLALERELNIVYPHPNI
ncbi:uncharacterized protein LOC117169136 isoform X2 [Belonocnema kinseyi]|uniref:uncharacterized protein LOC117169136 isoform X2 n=1 Tax=Belonocnema kinseyi TaxID=2817044 RepID=UPI00143D1C01|nr:uncharacterized protein LOC117169136 isoform X2 [Belonocnema kinseyi]